MLRMGPVLTRDNDRGVFRAELECTARYRDLLYARIGEGIAAPTGIGPGAYCEPGRKSGV